MLHSREITEYVEVLAAMPDYEVQVAHAALIIAGYEYPHLSEFRYLRFFDKMGDKLRSRIAGFTEPPPIIKEINRLLRDEEGFKRNTSDYYDPRNCLFNEVIDRLGAEKVFVH
ncbi:MAG: transglutaminase family protein [Thermodesulfobacteriota bacterium]